jgi:hypothetical protein
MRLSAVSAFVLPLSALAAPSLVKRYDQYDPKHYDNDPQPYPGKAYSKRGSPSEEDYKPSYPNNPNHYPDRQSDPQPYPGKAYSKRGFPSEEDYKDYKDYKPFYPNNPNHYPDRQSDPQPYYGKSYSKRGSQYDGNVDKYSGLLRESRDYMSKAYESASKIDNLHGMIAEYRYKEAYDKLYLDDLLKQLLKSGAPVKVMYVDAPH